MRDLLYEMIDYHNEMIDKMSDLAETLLDTYKDVEETAVNDAYCDAWDHLQAQAIFLCCEANSIDNGGWCTTEGWYVMRNEDTSNYESEILN